MAGSDRLVELVRGLLAHVQGIIGEGAAYAMLHYGAVEEGKKLAAGRPGVAAGDDPESLRGVVDEIGAMIGQPIKLVEGTRTRAQFEVSRSSLFASSGGLIEGVLLGVIEGALWGLHGKRFTGQIIDEDSADVLSLVFEGAPR